MSEDNEKLFGDQKIPFKVMVKRISHYVLPEWKSFFLAFILIIVNVGFDVILPYIIGKFTDAVADTNVAFGFIAGLAIGWFTLSVVSQVLVYFESMILQKTGQRIIYKLRMEVFTHI